MKTYIQLLYKSFYDTKFVANYIKDSSKSGFSAKIFLALMYALAFSISSNMGSFSSADTPDERATKVQAALAVFIFGTFLLFILIFIISCLSSLLARFINKQYGSLSGAEKSRAITSATYPPIIIMVIAAVSGFVDKIEIKDNGGLNFLYLFGFCMIISNIYLFIYSRAFKQKKS
ncbi:MAG: hypothetical protein LBL47_01885 [Lactobacillus sp.]|jgi:Na+-transporting methylmalonyl-CoA/oxaloacetate decarboxylase gamma subunit|nr:hypothetical protein [Lactobacillus sp.]